ncbi:MAG TPA: hypothetical protein VM242_08040, partial [Acidimicrobiales bacterium]|nr:hypothetical protein [Acidimicrobiales bacterium]
MLLISLVFVTVFAVLITAVITFTDVGLRASRGFGERGRTTYATDGAVQASIHRYASGGPCDDFDAPVRADGDPVGGRALTVHCSGPPPGGERANKPVNALLSLGTAAGEVGVETTAPMRVLGSVFSNSTVKAGGTLVVQGAVEATGNCTGPVQTDPPGGVRCANSPPDAGVADLSRGRDPRYVKARSTVPGRRSVPPCPAAPEGEVEVVEAGLEPQHGVGACARGEGGQGGGVVVVAGGQGHQPRRGGRARGHAAAPRHRRPGLDVPRVTPAGQVGN